jgi:photosystem II stability/assembly factor-like uncharacterized protein
MAVLKTVDGGESWARQVQAESEEITSVYFVNTEIGFKVSNDGKILKTENSGASWSAQNSPARESLHAVFFTDTKTGWVAGGKGTIAATTDGGKNWELKPSNTNEDLTSIYFIDNQAGWASGKGIVATVDGGSNWSAEKIKDWESRNDILGLHFLDRMTGYGFEEADRLLFLEGGAGWSAISTTLPDTKNRKGAASSAFFLDKNNGWIVGTGGAAWKGKGTKWTELDTGESVDLHGVYFSDQRNGWVVGDGGTVLSTSDGGNFWHPQTSGNNHSLYGIRFKNANEGIAFGPSIVLRTPGRGQDLARCRTLPSIPATALLLLLRAGRLSSLAD